MSIRDFPKSLSQAILVGRILVGRLGVRSLLSPALFAFLGVGVVGGILVSLAPFRTRTTGTKSMINFGTKVTE